MKKKVFCGVLCLLLLFSLLPLPASAVASDTDLSPKNPAVPSFTRQDDRFEWPMALMIGLVCFGAAITTAVIIFKKKQGETL